MSFLSLRSNSKPRVLHILDLDDELLKKVFARCNSVDMTRCSLVNHRFREIIEDMEDEQSESLRCSQKARIFVCDRRRAILEGMSTHTPTRLTRLSETSNVSRNSSRELLISPRERKHSMNLTKSTATSGSDSSGANQNNNNNNNNNPCVNTPPFISDQYADTKQPNWAFQFDFNVWIQNYEITEVLFKNFCSFFQREKGEMELNYKGSSGGSSHDEGRMYDRLPSTLNSQTVSTNAQYKQLLPKDIEALKGLSAGRVERLAAKLENVRNAHFVFKDYCCYNSRPPALIFWFLSMVRRNVSRITFDRVQAPAPVEAHDVLHLANIHRLTVIQAENKPGLIVRANLLLNWLKMPTQIRKKISIHLTGCKELTPKGLAAFVTAWKAKPEAAVFKQISIDGNSYKYNDFIHEIERLQEEYEKVPPRSPFSKPFSDENAHDVVLQKTVEICHSKDPTMVLRFKYCKPSRRMVLTCESDDLPPLKLLSPVPTFSRLSLSRPNSSATLADLRNSTAPSSLRAFTPDSSKRGSMTRPLSQNQLRIAGCRENGSEDGSIVNRFLRFLATSN